MTMKSTLSPEDTDSLDAVGRSYYCFCLEQAALCIMQARQIVAGNVIDENHQLPLIEQLLAEALDAA